MKTRRGDLKYPRLSYEVVGCAMKVHRGIGPGQDEHYYHLGLVETLKQKGIPYQYKPTGDLVHRGMVADQFEADLIVDDKIIPELKVLEAGFADEHYTQLICYLKFWRKELGLLIDFGKESLEHERVPFTERQCDIDAASAREGLRGMDDRDQQLGIALIEAVSRLAEQYGLGYRDTTYIGLLRAELTAEKIPFAESPPASISLGERVLGTSALKCFLMDGRAVVRVYALYDEVHAAHRATVQAYAKHLGVPFGLVVNFGKRAVQIRAVKPSSR